MKSIRITPIGRMANQMIQFMNARRLQQLVPDSIIHGHDLPLWGLSAPTPEHLKGAAPRLSGILMDIHHAARLMNAGRTDAVHLTWLSVKMDSLVSLEEARSLFVPENDSIRGYGETDLVIHIRGEDMLELKHPDYVRLPISFYVEIVRKTGLRPVFLGQLEHGRYLDALVQAFPDAAILPARDAFADFQTIRKSKNIVLGVSTFSWLAAWLSHASQIHFPVCGLFNPLQKPEIKALPQNDDRYVYYRFPIQRRNQGLSEEAALYNRSIPFEKIEIHRLRKISNHRSWRVEAKRLAKRWKFAIECRQHKRAAKLHGERP
ncbi:MAG TPA: hypothetical protein PKX16_01745 [Kiritimatiellia bacterium]|nr:hypothetical protein [Kiritimatiellia bacterium]